MTTTVRIAGAQLDLAVGDLAGNESRILEAMEWAADSDADMLLLPELAITGYPPEDLVLRDGFVAENLAVLGRLADKSGECAVVVGFVDALPTGQIDDDSVERRVANAAAVLRGGKIVGVYHKQLLPNYGVFDEARYFAEGSEDVTLWEIGGAIAGVSVCEDIWSVDGPPARQVETGARLLLNINGSPYHIGKGEERAAMLADRARSNGVPLVYLNTVGGQDELVFDGDSMVFAADGELLYRAAQFDEELFVLDVPVSTGEPASVAPTAVSSATEKISSISTPQALPRLGADEEVYRALQTGLAGYVDKNGFPGVVVGLSGGIDSALTAALAVDALGAERVWGVTMPSRYSSDGSIEDSRDLGERLGFRFETIPIDGIFQQFLDDLAGSFADAPPDVTEENLQARIRGTILMALSNKFGHMVLATGNKSEMAVGYATLYGDMAGGYAVLKDLYKTGVYRLARWRNRQSEVIPQAIVDKPPSAELRPDQLDSDSLPDYETLDAILSRYIEQDASPAEIVAAGFDRSVVVRVVQLVDRNEYKRRQAPPGVKITKKAFGRDRRLPITNLDRTVL